MDIYRTEEEQIAAVKRWWKSNGKSIVIGIALAAAAIFGWQAWQEQQRQAAEAASGIYFNLLEAVEINDEAQTSTVMFLADQLKSDFSSSVYAQYGALLAARQAMVTEDFKRAEDELQWAVEHSEQGESIYLIAKLRLARVVAAQSGKDNVERALDLIKGVDAGGHLASYEEIKGDLYLRLGQVDKARNAYQLAIDETRKNGGNRVLLAIKLNDLTADQVL